jgi:hypothetical protein
MNRTSWVRLFLGIRMLIQERSQRRRNEPRVPRIHFRFRVPLCQKDMLSAVKNTTVLFRLDPDDQAGEDLQPGGPYIVGVEGLGQLVLPQQGVVAACGYLEQIPDVGKVEPDEF